MPSITIEIDNEDFNALTASTELLDGLFSPQEIAAILLSGHLKTETPNDIKDEILDGLQETTENSTA